MMHDLSSEQGFVTKDFALAVYVLSKDTSLSAV